MKMLQLNFIMIYIIHKIIVLLKIIRILKQVLRSIIYLKKNYFFSQHMMKRLRLEEDIEKNIEGNIIKYLKNLKIIEKKKKKKLRKRNK